MVSLSVFGSALLSVDPRAPPTALQMVTKMASGMTLKSLDVESDRS